MVMQKIMLSPCLICENEEIYDWVMLEDTLKFINNYLECGLDSVEGSIFHMNSWYTPPAFCVNMYNYFTACIFPLLSDLLKKGEVYSVEKDIESKYKDIQNSDFIITNYDEVNILIYYTQYINNDYVMFVGKPNYKLKEQYIEILSEKKMMKIPVVKNPFFRRK